MKKILSLFAAVMLMVGSMSATTIYCKMDKAWWKADGAAVAVHYWGGETAATTWPGVRMAPVEGDADVWSYDVPADVTGLIFVRVNGSGDIADWGAKTADLALQTDGKNLYTITSEDPVWGDPGVAGDWSVYGEDPVSCDWASIEFLGGPAEYANQFKVCKADGEHPGVVNIQQPGWATEVGIYMTFPSAAFGEISLPATAYDVDGAGIIFHLSAFTQEYTEVSVVCNNDPIVFIVYNAAAAPQPVQPDYYLAGTMTDWAVAFDDAHKFAVNPHAEGEYKLSFTFAVGDMFKVVKVEGEAQTWLPEDYEGAYAIDSAHAGLMDVYFRPDGQGAQDWHYGYIYVAKPAAHLDAPDAAPAAPTYPAEQVKAVYSATYSADCDFGEWGSGTQYVQEEFGKKYITGALGYFGLAFENRALNCSDMESLHLDVWIADDASIRITPIHGGTEVGVTKQLVGQQWNSIDIALSEFEGVTDWSNVYQVKIDNAANLTFWLNNVYFYTTVAPTVDLEDGYYVIGLNGWTVYDLTAADKFAANGEAEGEFMITKTLAEGNKFKVVAVANNELGAWYPGEAGDYVVDFAHAGEKTIYFRPNYDGGEDWYAGCIYVPETEDLVPFTTSFATHGWAADNESYAEWDAENQKITVHLILGKSAQWQAQVKYHAPVAEAGKCYRLGLKMVASKAINNVTVKYQDDKEMFYKNDISMATNVEFVLDTVVPGLADGNGILVFDFGFAEAETVIEISNIVVEEAECPEPPVAEANYYLVGSMTEWAVVAEDAYKFVANPEAEGEYMLNYTFAEGDKIKVVKVEGEAQTWYPDGMDNEYTVDAAHAGAVIVYFRPAGGVEGWHYGYFYVTEPTGIDNTIVETKAQKMIENGQLIIIKNGVKYNALGTIVR